MPRKSSYPGAIVQKGNSLYIKHKNRWHRTGLKATKSGFKEAERLKANMWERGAFADRKSPTLTIEQYWNKYTEVKFPSFKDSTCKKYTAVFNKVFVDTRYANTTFTAQNIHIAVEKYLRDNAQLKNATVNSALRTLQAWCNWCTDHNVLEPINLMRLYSRKIGYERRQVFTQTEVLAITNECYRQDEEFGRFISVLSASGMRIHELLSLKKDQVLPAGLLLENKTTGKPEIAEIDENAWTFLRWQLQKAPPGDRVWKWSENSHSYLLKKLRQAALLARVKIGKRTFHTFRRTKATEMFEAGEPLTKIKKVMRHSSIVITERHYYGWKAEGGNTKSVL